MFQWKKCTPMTQKSSKMNIPLYHKTPVKDSPKFENSSNGKYTSDSLKRGDHKNGTVCEIENALEIQLNLTPIQTSFIPFLLISWIPLLLLIFFVHYSASHQINTQKLQLVDLETQVSSMSQELLFLRKKLFNGKIQNFEERAISLPIKEIENTPIDGWNDTRREKRNVNNEMQKDFKDTSSTPRKVPNINAGRRGKQASSKDLKRLRAPHRHQCPRRLGYLSSICGGRHDLQAIHLKGAYPETVVETGFVGPWFIDTFAVKDSRFSSSFQLRQDGESVEIETAGLYFIYAQVYYLTSHSLNSFTIKSSSRDSENPSTLAYCSTNTVSSSSTSEVSCFTASVHTLQAGDRVFVQQREKQRRLIMRTGHSFLGIIKLGSS